MRLAIATGYNGTVHLGSSDAASVTSADAALTNGVGTFTVTPMTLGQQTLTAVDVSDGSVVGSEVINVTPGWGVRIGMTSLQTSMVAGQTQSTLVTIYDSFGNVSTVFTGWIKVSTSDARTGTRLVFFSAADQGVKSIPIALYTAGTQSVTIADNANPLATMTQSGIVVSPNVGVSASSTLVANSVAGEAQNITVSVRDAYGNVATVIAAPCTSAARMTEPFCRATTLSQNRTAAHTRSLSRSSTRAVMRSPSATRQSRPSLTSSVTSL